MKWLFALLFALLLISVVSAQEFDPQFLLDLEGSYVPTVGIIHLNIPNQTLENSKITLSAAFFPDQGFLGDLKFKDGNNYLENTHSPEPFDTENDSYVIYTWELFLKENKELTFQVMKEGKIEYEKNFFINVKKREQIGSPFITEKTVPLSKEFNLENLNLKEQLLEEGIALSDEELKEQLENAKDISATKKIENTITNYEGNLTVVKTKTIIDLKNISGMEIYVIEYVNKSVTQNASDIDFEVSPIILEEDPLMMWHLKDASEESLSYQIEKDNPVQNELTGNTILLVKSIERKNNWRVILSLLLIPLIAFLIIYFGNVDIKKNK